METVPSPVGTSNWRWDLKHPLLDVSAFAGGRLHAATETVSPSPFPLTMTTVTVPRLRSTVAGVDPMCPRLVTNPGMREGPELVPGSEHAVPVGLIKSDPSSFSPPLGPENFALDI